MNWIAKWILTFKRNLGSKTLLTFFQEKSKWTLSLVSTERRHKREVYFSLACLITLLVLHCLSLLCFSGHLLCIANKKTHKQICCNFFLWVVLTRHLPSWTQEFNFWFWFYCSMTLFSLSIKAVIWQIFMKAFLSLTRLAKLS